MNKSKYLYFISRRSEPLSYRSTLKKKKKAPHERSASPPMAVAPPDSAWLASHLAGLQCWF